MSNENQNRNLGALILGAIGVVYGDIGTSPLYAMKETFAGHHPMPVDVGNVLGVLSLVFWTVMMLVTLKYVTLIMRADNHGEGGSLALLALVNAITRDSRLTWLVSMLGIFAAALFYGDSMITPAISVLSAVEGMLVVSPALHSYVIPITAIILTALSAIQRRGTGAIGIWFGPVMCLWFATLALLGILHIADHPSVLAAVNPAFAISIIIRQPWVAFLALGSVVLAVTGGEALYTDMGHFGRFPIRVTWFSFVMPALLLNYFGQGALLLVNPKAIENPFFLLTPEWARIPMVVLATLATVIASQAVISGAFSVAQQAMRMGYLPQDADHPYLGARVRADLHPGDQLVAVPVGDGLGVRLPEFQQSGGRLRHCGHRDDDDRHHPGGLRDALPVALESLAGAAVCRFAVPR